MTGGVLKIARRIWEVGVAGSPVIGGKTKYILIAYFLGNIFAKNCRNQTVYVKIIASQMWDVLFETQ